MWTRWTLKMRPDLRLQHQRNPAAAGLPSGTGATGLEPATSGVTGRRSNRLSYAPVRRTVWQPKGDGEGRGGDACHCSRVGIRSDMYIGIGTLIIIIILLLILL
jgi:hypothetical protein